MLIPRAAVHLWSPIMAASGCAHLTDSGNLINSINIQCVIIIPADLHSIGRKGLVWGVVRVGEVVANI